MNELNFVDFDQLLDKVKLNGEAISVLPDYLELIFESLVSRMEAKLNFISKDVFCSYFDLPFLISEKVFRIFDRNFENKLIQKHFTEGLQKLYTGQSPSAEILKRITFNIFLFSEIGEQIKLEDVSLVLNLLDNEEMFFGPQEIEKIVNNFFDGQNSLAYYEYDEMIENKNSDIFFLLVIFLIKKQPFKEKALKFFKYVETKKNIEKNYNNNRPLFKRSMNLNFTLKNTKVRKPSRVIMNYMSFNFKKTPTPMKRKYGNKNVLKHNEEIDIIDKTFYFKTTFSEDTATTTYITENSLTLNYNSPPNDSNNFHNCNSSNNFNNLNIFEFLPKSTGNSLKEIFNINEKSIKDKDTPQEVICQKFVKNQKLKKIKLILIGQDLFTYYFSRSKQNFLLRSITPLNDFYVSDIDDMVFQDKTYSSLALMEKCGSSFADIENIYIFENPSDRDDFLNKIKNSINDRDFKDHYRLNENLLNLGGNISNNIAVFATGVDLATNDKVEVKIISKTSLNTPEHVYAIKKEIDNLKYLKCINYLKSQLSSEDLGVKILKDFFEDRKYIYLVSEKKSA